MNASVVYSMNVSLDGYINSASGSLDWTHVDDEIHQWWNNRIGEAAAFLYGRRLYEAMAAYWPTAEDDPDATPMMLEFARIWLEKPKVVFSHSLQNVDWNSRLVRGDVAQELALLKDEFAGPLDVGGADLAGQFIERGLIDRYRPVVHPVVLGRGTPFFPVGFEQQRLRLRDTKRFASGVVMLDYEMDRSS
jgi:dihydrofolate reductase